MKSILVLLVAIIVIVSCTEKDNSEIQNARIFDAFVKNPIASRLPDFSYAGYHYSERSIPDIHDKYSM